MKPEDYLEAAKKVTFGEWFLSGLNVAGVRLTESGSVRIDGSDGGVVLVHNKGVDEYGINYPPFGKDSIEKFLSCRLLGLGLQPAPMPKGTGLISVKDRPLFTEEGDEWVVTKEAEGEFVAAVPFHDFLPDKTTWWVRHCVVEEDGTLCIVGGVSNEPAGCSLQDVEYWLPWPPPPVVSPDAQPLVDALTKMDQLLRWAVVATQTIHQLGEDTRGEINQNVFEAFKLGDSALKAWGEGK